MRNETKVVLFSLTISALLGFTQVPNSIQYAYGAGCAPEDVQHWNKITFFTGQNILHESEVDIMDSQLPYEVLIQVDPDDGVSFVPQLVADLLNERGYFLEQGGEITGGSLAVIEVEYSAFCNNFGLAQMVGGMFIQPDSATLVLAYGIANAIWIVPSVAGIGIAVYLVKRRF